MNNDHCGFKSLGIVLASNITYETNDDTSDFEQYGLKGTVHNPICYLVNMFTCHIWL